MASLKINGDKVDMNLGCGGCLLQVIAFFAFIYILFHLTEIFKFLTQ